MTLAEKPSFRLTIHRKLGITFSLSAGLMILVGALGYFFYSLEMIIITTSSAVAAIMTAGFFIYRSITKPMDGVKKAIKEIAKRNFDVMIREDNRCDEIGELARTLTQMKDELKEQDRLKDEFINIASHELRTPIQPIVSFVDLARRGVIGQEKAFQVITEQAWRLKRLADDILDASRIEGGRLVLQKEYFSVNDLLAMQVEQRRLSLGNDLTMTFSSNIKRIESAYVYADKSRVNQVLTNIVDNAVKFTKKGSIDIATRLIDTGGVVEIMISDSGGGIPDEMFPKLFTKFATKSVAAGAENGTGLGLFISKAIVEAHGGTIAGLNNERGGATFKIILPIEQRKAEEDKNDEKENHSHDHSHLSRTEDIIVRGGH
jgi:signal transduction histidine kinase